MVKDLGYSSNAYERAKEKLEKKYGGERCTQLKQLSTLRSWQKLRPRNLDDLEEFLAVLDRVLVVLRDCESGELTGQSLNLTAKEKIPEEDIQAYKLWLFDQNKRDTFESLTQWIEMRVQIMDEAREEAGEFYGRKTGRFDDRNDDRRRVEGFNSSRKARKCIVEHCREDHPPWTCRIFKEMTVPKRKELIARSGRCFRCLATGHFSRECPNARRCGVDGCLSNKHSSYLHDRERQTQYTTTSQTRQGQIQDAEVMPTSTGGVERSTPPEFTPRTRIHVTNYQDENVSRMVLPAFITNGSKKLKVNVMLDPCYTGSYVTEQAAAELMLQGQNQILTITGTGEFEVNKLSRLVEFPVASLDGRFSANLQANVLDNITGDMPAFQWSELKTRWPHLEPIPFESIARRRQIDVLIGSDHPVFHRVLKETCGSQQNDPVARPTNLGWVCFGPTLVQEFRRKSQSHFTRTYRASHVTGEESVDNLLRNFWDLETLGIRETADQSFTPEEKAAINQVTKTHQLKDRRYQMGIPWRKGEPTFDNNYDMALSRLKSQETALLKRDPKIAETYGQVIKDYERKGYVKHVSQAKEQWLLPHFPILRKDKTTSKVRIVFDAAAKYHGKSLNDAILPGPKLQRELVDVLVRFRRAPVALSADISEMFLQVALRDEDRRYHRFLWRNFDKTREPDVYEFCRLLFGNTASPFCAQFTLQTHAQAHAADYPSAAETVTNSMYVDHVLDSCETVPEAQTFRRQLSELLVEAGFKLRKWLSNEAAVIADVPPVDALSSLKITEEGLPPLKTLGVLWRSDKDVFTFDVKPPQASEKATKRNVLSAIARLFDPLQLLAPFTIRAKIIMQETWAAGLNWDDSLPDYLDTKWKAWIAEIPELLAFQIPRCLREAFPTDLQLHVFSDASKDAYASAAYLVCRYEEGAPTSCLIASKSRLSPLKAMTIPRLELMGAILSTRLAKNILKLITVSKTTFWSNSTNVLFWVRNQSRNFKPFVSNQISEIHESTEPQQWRHIPGEINPAELLTRGLAVADLVKSRMWLEGPDLLKNEESTWPDKLPNCTKDQADQSERRKEQTHVTRGCHEETKVKPCIDPNNFSSFSHLICVTGWLLRFLNYCRLPSESREKTRVLTQDDMTKAEFIWLRRTQTESFPGGEQEKGLVQLNPQKDEERILRMNGRLRFADELPYDARHPILLPKDHPVTRLIIAHLDERLGHGTGVEHLLTELRARFIKGRRAVRNVVEACRECRRIFLARPLNQIMAPLLRSRVKTTLKAFECVGVDFGGPYMTKQGRGKTRAKRYLCLFTCLTTRAMHLEMSYSLDTDSFVNAFVRMTSRRGTPSFVVDDNGTNFVGAERELRQLVGAFDHDQITRKTTRHHHITVEVQSPIGPPLWRSV